MQQNTTIEGVRVIVPAGGYETTSYEFIFTSKGLQEAFLPIVRTLST